MQQSISPDVRRQSDRHLIKTYAFVHCRGQFQSAKVIDYSTGGLQLEGTFGLIKTDPIQIEFISGILVPARVAWSLGAQTGIVFFEPLSIDHPALIELLRRAGTYLPNSVILATENEQRAWKNEDEAGVRQARLGEEDREKH
jgi:PilZ domain